MPNLNPAPDSPEHLEAELALIRRDAVVRVLPYGSITRGQKGRGELVDFGALAGEVVGFSDDGRGVQGEELMAEAMRRAAAVGKPIVAHCEVDELLKGGYIHDGVYCREHGHKGICSESEWRQVERDLELVREVKRVLRPGGKFIVTTPNAPMSLTRNPWHIREYTAAELRSLLGSEFSSVEALGVSGNARVMEYYEQNRRSVKRITRFDILDLQHRLPRCLLQFPYDVLNRINRRRLLKSNTDLTTSIRMDDYRIEPVGDSCFDLFYIAVK